MTTQYVPFTVHGDTIRCEYSTSSDGRTAPLLFACVSPLDGGAGVFLRPDEMRELADAMEAWEAEPAPCPTCDVPAPLHEAGCTRDGVDG